MNNLKKMIIILSILIVFVIFLLIFILSKNKNIGKNQNEDTNTAVAAESVKLATTIILEQNDITFYSIEKNLQNFCLYSKVTNANAINSLLYEEYKNAKNITPENVLENINKIDAENYEFSLRELYVNQSHTKPAYYAYGTLLQNKQKQNQYFIVYVDQSTMSWSLEPITENEYNELIKGEKTDEQKTIQRNDYNEFIRVKLTKEDIAKKYLEDYVYTALNDVQNSYKTLNNEYSKAKYGSLEKYEQYIQKRRAQLETLDYHSIKSINDFNTQEEYENYMNNLVQKGLKQYSITGNVTYTQCICIDDYDNYYIFNITSPMQYTVILDTYTIDLPEFTEQYNKSTNEKKVQLNIAKFFAAINNEDYEYAYSKLDETFRNNNFGTLANFETYIKNNFYISNKVAASTPESQSGVYVFNVTISDASENSNNADITKNFVMKLTEGTNFVTSFNI